MQVLSEKKVDFYLEKLNALVNPNKDAGKKEKKNKATITTSNATKDERTELPPPTTTANLVERIPQGLRL